MRQAYDYWQDQPGYMVAESVRPKPTESYREDYKICSRCNFTIASQHFFANPQNENTPMIDPRRRLQRLDSLFRLMTMTNSRCFRIDLKLNRFVTSTKCNPTIVLSAVSARKEPKPPDCTTPQPQLGAAEVLQSRGYRVQFPDHTFSFLNFVP